MLPARRRRVLGATAAALALLLGGVLPAQGQARAQAQTELSLVVPAGQAQSLAGTVQEVRGRIDWPYGPVVVRLLPGTASAVETAAAESAVARIVLVPLFDPTLTETAGLSAQVSDLAHALTGISVAGTPDSEPQFGHAEIAEAVDLRGEPVAVARAVQVAALAALVHASTVDAFDLGPVRVTPLERITVTATRAERRVFAAPVPVTVLTARALEERGAHNAADALRNLQGLDVEGVGPNQHRPVIRGLRGQRILLLEDGIRWNNPRRRVESGEPASLVGLGSIERVEIVRGPASVLYGSDGIGGVVNILTRGAFDVPATLGGRASARWGSAGAERRIESDAWGRSERFALQVGAGYRQADPFRAPPGEFGDVVLSDGTEVEDSGVEDWSARIEAAWQVAAGQTAFLRHERYEAENAGYGLLDPEALGSESTVRLRTPSQTVNRTSAGLRAVWPGSALAERLTLTVYRQSNVRTFLTEVHSPLPGPPGAMLDITTRSDTDLGSLGTRIEASARAPWNGTITYGVEAFRERSTNNDTSTSIVSGLGPPSINGRSGSRVPNANLTQVGLFGQLEHDIGPRVSFIAGARYQWVHTRAHETPGYEGEARTTSDGTFVAALNALVRPATGLILTASVARGFRTPNLIEQFYTGPAPEGRAYWLLNPGLGPETSVNVEVGARFETRSFWADASLYQNTVHDGITLEATGDSIDERIAFRNVNVEKLRFRGFELSAGAQLPRGVSITAGHSILDVNDLRDPNRIFAESYPTKTTASARWDPERSPLWLEYAIRSNGSSDGPVAGAGPVGERVPGFTVQDARIGARIGSHRLILTLSNLANVLYAESLNVGAFRPEPGRAITLSWSAVF